MWRSLTGDGLPRSGPAEPGDLSTFLLELGRLLLTAGDAVSDIEARLQRIAVAWGASQAQFMVLPGSVVLALGPRESAQMMTVVDLEADSLRLDQVTEVFVIAREAERGRLVPSEGLRRLAAVRTTAHPYGTAAAIVGEMLLVLGMGLSVSVSAASLALFLGLGAIVAVMGEVADRVPGLDAILPVGAATVVSFLTFMLSGRAYDDATVLTLVPPLVVLLPGALLTMATIDLAAGESVTGASRLLAGLLQLGLLSFGIVAGAGLAGVSPEIGATTIEPGPWWVAWIGVLVFAVGVGLEGAVPMQMMPWLLVVLVGAFGGQLAGEAWVGPAISGFAGGVVTAPLASLVERLPSGPPAFVAFLPAFWLLVPGAVGLLGVSQLVIDDPIFGLVGFVEALTSIVAIALGILVGLRITSVCVALAAASARRRQRSTGGGESPMG